MFGIDFSYKGNLHFAEAGRASVEFWLSKAMFNGIQVEVAATSYFLIQQCQLMKNFMAIIV